MELDINPKWVSFAMYDHSDPAQPGIVTGHNLYDGMAFDPPPICSANSATG